MGLFRKGHQLWAKRRAPKPGSTMAAPAYLDQLVSGALLRRLRPDQESGRGSKPCAGEGCGRRISGNAQRDKCALCLEATA